MAGRKNESTDFEVCALFLRLYFVINPAQAEQASRFPTEISRKFKMMWRSQLHQKSSQTTPQSALRLTAPLTQVSHDKDAPISVLTKTITSGTGKPVPYKVTDKHCAAPAGSETFLFMPMFRYRADAICV